MTRSMQALAAVSLAALSLALASPASAQEACDPLDVTCVVPDTAGSGQDTVAKTVDTVTGTAKPVVDDPQGVVGRILNPGTVDPPGGGTGGGSGNGGGGRDQPRGHGTADHQAGKGSHVPRAPQQPRSAGPRSAGPHPADASSDNSSIGAPASKEPVFADQVAGAVHVVAQSLGVVLALLAVAVGFVMVQDRIDRRDPKLRLAPVQAEMIGFS